MPLLAAPVLASIIGGGASIAGGALANKSKSSSTPTMDPAYAPLQGQILDMITKRLNGSTDLSGYGASGTSNINHTFDTIKQAQDNNLTARGLGTSPVAGAVDATRESARGGHIADFTNSLPLLQRDMQTQDLGLANQILGMGRGVTSTGSSGGGAAGGAESLAQYLGYLSGQGAFDNMGKKPFTKPTPGNPNLPYQPQPFLGWG